MEFWILLFYNSVLSVFCVGNFEVEKNMKYYWKFIDQKENYGLQRCLNENHKFTIYCEYKYPDPEDIDREDVIYADSFNDLQIAIQNLMKIWITKNVSLNQVISKITKKTEDDLLTIEIPLIFSRLLSTLEEYYKILEIQDYDSENFKKLNGLASALYNKLFYLYIDNSVEMEIDDFNIYKFIDLNEKSNEYQKEIYF